MFHLVSVQFRPGTGNQPVSRSVVISDAVEDFFVRLVRFNRDLDFVLINQIAITYTSYRELLPSNPRKGEWMWSELDPNDRGPKQTVDN